MSYKNGIQICNKTIVRLVAGNDLEENIDAAFIELSKIGILDTSIENFNAIIDWCEKYNLNKESAIILVHNSAS